MARPLVLTSKFLGLAGLGLLSSSALTLSFSTLPALLSLPTPSDALPAFYTLRQHAAAAHHLLSIATAALLVGGFALSPRVARHPYMLYTAITVCLGLYAVPYAARKMLKVRGQELDFEALDQDVEREAVEEGRGRSGKGQEVRLNGEVVREVMEGWRKVLGWQSAVWGLGWALGTVGIWGDGF